MLLAVGSDEMHVEALRLVEVELNRRHLPLAADGVLHLEVDLGAVERASALVHLDLELLGGYRLLERLYRLVPTLGLPHRLLGARGEVGLDVREAEALPHVEREPQDLEDLVLHLLGGAEYVRVILREAAHAQEPVQDPALLVAVDGAELRPPKRQVAVGADLRLVDHDVERAVHRLDVKILPVYVHRRVHPLAVEIEVTRGFPEGRAAYVRRIEYVVAVLEVLVLPERLDRVADARAPWVPEHEAGAVLVHRREEVELGAELPVVALACLLEHREVGAELLLRAEGGAIDALEHRVLLVASPVRTRDLHQLERADLARPSDVRAAAEIHEIAVAIDGDHAPLGELVDQLELIGLACKELARPLASDLLAREREVFRHDLLHLGLDGGEVLGRECVLAVEVVVETVLDRRAYGDLRPWKKAEDGVGHDVRGRVPYRLELQKLPVAFFSHFDFGGKLNAESGKRGDPASHSSPLASRCFQCGRNWTRTSDPFHVKEVL